MWPGFSYDSNFITDALRQQTSLPLTGIPYDPSVSANLLIFGPYGQTWKSVQGIPKIFFSAENWKQPADPSIALYLTSSRTEDATHLRIPTWMTFLDWFSGSTELPTDHTVNPIRLPVHFAMTPHPIPFSERHRFCGFVVSNPVCDMRNNAFHAINQYKTVDSGGALYNNMGGQLSLKYPGGGCGDISKYHFFSDCQFTISFENSQAPGYITEKLLHAKMAGCVPLYWGDEQTDFVPNSFINVSKIQNPTVLVTIIKKMEENPAMCAKMAATPLLDETRKQAAYQVMKKMSQAILELAGVPQIQGVKKTYVINLDTRLDRWNNLIAAEPYLEPLVERVSGVNGKTLVMTAEIYQLFEKNQFQWKKSVIGCNLSHISIWRRIAEGADGEWHLVLEDDVRFHSGWREQWAAYTTQIPADAELLYLGGVLPPNKPALPHALQAVNKYWSCIKPNTFFSSVPMPVFHFCAYSYLLTPAGARKIMSFLTDSEQRSFTVSDHLLGSPAVGLKRYVATPLLSYCFQEEDPVYVQSAFNELHREDTFDSDIWNNKDCFTGEDLAPFCRPVLSVMTRSEGLYETRWLEDILQVKLNWVPIGEHKAGAWYLVQRPHEWTEFFRRLDQPFRVLHVSDEFGMDDISFYSFPMCKAVIRNYLRPDLPSHVLTIPLGYHHRYEGTSAWTDRDLRWSFHGTDWFDRAAQLEPFLSVEPHSLHLQPHWNHPTATKEADYLKVLGRTQYCPILRGQNAETFRFYEALEAGCIPVTTITDALYLSWIESHLGLESLYEWSHAMKVLTQDVRLEEVRVEVGERWRKWKEELRRQCGEILALKF